MSTEPNIPDSAGLQEMIASAGVPVMVVDGDGNIAFWNDEAAALFGYDADEFATLRVGQLMPDRYREVHERHMDRYRQQPRFRSMESGIVLAARRRDGTEFAVEISLGPFDHIRQSYVMAVVRERGDENRIT